MLHIVKNKSLRLPLIGVFFLLSFQLVAGDLTVMKYGYGKRGFNGTDYEKAEVHFLNEKYDEYTVFDFKKIYKNTKFNADIGLSIEQKNNDVLATVTIKNLGTKTFYIRKIEFPLYLSSEKPNKHGVAKSMSCGSGFFVTTSNILLDYLGSMCDYGGNFDKEDWAEFQAGETFSYTVMLNDSFEFFHDKKNYEIGTAEYNLVNDEWFLDRDIYNYLFSIFDVELYDCYLKGNVKYIYKKNKICQRYYFRDKGMEKTFDMISFDGINNDNEINIMSNQVSVGIDGRKIKSLFDED